LEHDAGVGGAGEAVVVGGGEVLDAQTDLLEVVLAAGAVGRLADLLDGGQEQADQHRDDGDDDQQLDQRERRASAERRRADHENPFEKRTRKQTARPLAASITTMTRAVVAVRASLRSEAPGTNWA